MGETTSALMAASLFFAVVALGAKTDPVIRDRLNRLAPAERGGRLSIEVLERWGGSRLAKRIPKRDMLRTRIELAGSPASLEAVVGLKLALAFSLFGLTFVLATADRALLPLTPLTAIAGFQSPDIVVARLAKRRRAAIDAGIPELIELLVATTEAGLTLPVAFRRTAEVMQGALGEELRAGVAQLDLGVPWRRVLDGLVERTSLAWIKRLVATMGRTQRLGAPVGSSLRSLGDDLRRERRGRAEELARRAPVKMLFPLVFLILPAFLLLTVGPVLLATIKSLQ